MPGQAVITINENQWSVNVATTSAELIQGLSGQASLPAGTGMLFVLPTKQSVSVDTSQMLFPLDIIFISEGTVVDVASNIQPGYLVTEETPCDMFLEVNAGEAVGVEAGDTVSTATIQQPGFDWSSIISFAIPLAALGFVCALAGGMTKLTTGSSSSSSEVRRLGKPRTEKERAKAHKEFYGTKELPPRGTGLSERGESAESRRLGEPKTEAGRKETHKRKYGTEKLPERGKGLKERGEYGTCYEDAWRFLIKSEEGELVHGSVESRGKRIKHAWVELPTGFVWEPETTRFIRLDDFKVFKPREEARYTTTEAAIMAARTRNLGPWTEEEKRQILSREHHSMWLTLEQRKELEEKYGNVAVRWAEEATKPGDLKGAEVAAEYYYKKIREAFGLGHLSPKLSEEQIIKLREVLGLSVDVAEVLRIHRETGYVP